MTHDMDIVIQVSPKDASKLDRMFNPDEFYCPPVEVIRSEIVHHGQFNLIHHESGLKIDLVVKKQTDHASSEFGRRQRVPFWKGHEAYCASPEDIILAKLEYFRQGGSQKHVKDIRGILAETQIDETYVRLWVAKLGLEPQWLEAQGI